MEEEETITGILEAAVVTVLKSGSKAWAFQKMEEHLLDIFQRNCIQNGGAFARYFPEKLPMDCFGYPTD